MRLRSIPRGIIYHSLAFELKYFLRSFFTKKNDKNIIEKFEKEFARYMGTHYAVAFPFARTAIYFSLKTQNLPHSSEIIMPPITIKPMMDVVIKLNLKPVFVDIDPDTLCFDVRALKEAINKNTKAVLITYLFGITPNLKKILEICQGHDLFIVEDFSHNLNAEWQGEKLGTFGDVGVYSSSSIKTFDTFGGGLAITKDQKIYTELKSYQGQLAETSFVVLQKKIIINILRNFFTGRFIFSIFTLPLLKILSRMGPILEKKITGARLDLQAENELPVEWFQSYTSFQAAVGLALLPEIAKNDAKRIQNVETIKTRLSGKKFSYPQPLKGVKNVFWQFVVFSRNPGALKKALHKVNVDVATTNLTLISNLDIYPYKGDTPQAADIHQHAVFIPAYPNLDIKDLEKIALSLRDLCDI